MSFVPTVKSHSWEFCKSNCRPHEAAGLVFCLSPRAANYHCQTERFRNRRRLPGWGRGPRKMKHLPSETTPPPRTLLPINPQNRFSSGANISLLLKFKERKKLHVLVPKRQAQWEGRCIWGEEQSHAHVRSRIPRSASRGVQDYLSFLLLLH